MSVAVSCEMHSPRLGDWSERQRLHRRAASTVLTCDNVWVLPPVSREQERERDATDTRTMSVVWNEKGFVGSHGTMCAEEAESSSVVTFHWRGRVLECGKAFERFW